MERITLDLIGGFLSMPSDWDRWRKDPLVYHVHPHYTFGDPSEELTLPVWGELFGHAVKKEKRTKRVLIGYSLGGRLALHALQHYPHTWDAVILIGTRLGLKTEKEKVERLKRDLLWAEKFSKEPWQKLMQEWNEQPVFGGKQSPWVRNEEDYDRKALAKTFKYWSLANQDDMGPFISGFDRPVLWIGGEGDTGVNMVESLLHPLSEKWIVPRAYHRVPWEYPELFENKMNEFLTNVYSDLENQG